MKVNKEKLKFRKQQLERMISGCSGCKECKPYHDELAKVNKILKL